MTTPIGGTAATTRTQTVDDDMANSASALSASSSIPPPGYPNGPPVDDLQTALAVLMIETSRDQRAVADKERAAGTKAQEAAHERKIEKMRDVADEAFTQGVVDGVFEGISGAAQAGAACLSYSSTVKDIAAKSASCDVLAGEAAVAARASRLLDASSRLTSASGKIWSAAAKSAQESDRADIAVIEREIDRAKGGVDAASSDSKRAADDIRETINFVRQYLAAKTQAAQAAIIKG